MFLNDEELQALTRRQKPTAQARALAAMGLEYRVRPDGTIAVLTSHVQEQMGGTPSAAPTAQAEPDLSWID